MRSIPLVDPQANHNYFSLHKKIYKSWLSSLMKLLKDSRLDSVGKILFYNPGSLIREVHFMPRPFPDFFEDEISLLSYTVWFSVISRHSSARRCSGSRHTTCQRIHSSLRRSECLSNKRMQPQSVFDSS